MIAGVIDALTWEALFMANDVQHDDHLSKLRELLSKKNAESAREMFGRSCH